MRGVLLDSRGRPVDRTAHRPRRVECVYEFENPHLERDLAVAALPPEVFDPTLELERAPAHVRRSLERAEELGAFGPRGAIGWQETVRRLDSDGTQVLNSAAEAIMVPDYTLPADFAYGGRQLKYVLWGRCSTVVTTPGTVTFRLRWGGLAGVVLMASKAQRPKVTVSTNMACQLEMITHFRRAGNGTGAAIAMGTSLMGNTIGDAAAAGEVVWPDAPAEVTTLDTTTAKAFTPTIQFSVATATTAWTTHIARIEALT
jgi:hypothetical protein